jgi:serine/threonine protein phosphatase PrpC
MCDELIDLALKAGGYDNITIILVDFSLWNPGETAS